MISSSTSEIKLLAELKSYIETKLEKFESDRRTEQVSIRQDADALLKQMEDFKDQHRVIENKFEDINTDQQQISNELNTIQQHYDVQFQSINESTFIQNEDTFITKLNIIEPAVNIAICDLLAQVRCRDSMRRIRVGALTPVATQFTCDQEA